MEPQKPSAVVLNVSTPTRIGRTYSVALTGMKGQLVTVEADIGNALPGFTLLGLPDQSLQESKDRIRAAARNSGLQLTRRHLTVNLTPASLHKRGSHFDLAIIMAALGADYEISHETGPVFLATLGLDGSLQPAPGMLPAVMAAVEAGHPEVIVAEASAAQAKMVPGAQVRAFSHLSEIAHSFGAPIQPRTLPAPRVPQVHSAKTDPRIDLAEVQGQQEARWALEIAAAGGHHLLLQGPPGAGKTMLAERLPTIMADMEPKVALENTAIRTLIDGEQNITNVSSRPPFQAPHHSTSATALIGGGSGIIRPGAVSKAHGGVLFIDEAAEFRREVLDMLRQPLETGRVIVHRARHAVEFPAQFQLVMATNPCPCGYGYGAGKQCRCTSLQRRRYANRLSGPLLDRVDLQVAVHPLTSHDLNRKAPTEGSATVAARVKDAIDLSAQRLHPFGLTRNHQIPPSLLQESALKTSSKAKRILERALDAGEITARGYVRVLKVAWTIADLMQAPHPTEEHVDMALYLRVNGSGG